MNFQQCYFVINKKNQTPRKCSRSGKSSCKGYCEAHYKIVLRENDKQTASDDKQPNTSAKEPSDFIHLAMEHVHATNLIDKSRLEQMKRHAYDFLVGAS